VGGREGRAVRRSVAPEVTDEALDNYKKAFTEAFDYYSVEFVMTRAE
jgi:hypothetical protein